MQAVILAGGLGTRLRPLTEKIPKPMVQVLGKPFLWHMLRVLSNRGVKDVVLATGYLSRVIEDYFRDGSELGIRIRYSVEPSPRGTGGALLLAENMLQENFFVLYGDSLLEMDYRSLWDFHLSHGFTSTIVVYDNSDNTSVRNNVSIDREGIVVAYDKSGSTPDLGYVEAGVLVFSKKIFDIFPKKDVVSIETDIYPELIKRKQLIAYPSTERFYDIGTPSRLAEFVDFLKKRGN